VQSDDDEDDELPSVEVSAESLPSDSMEDIPVGARRFSLGLAGRPTDTDEPTTEPPSRIRAFWRRLRAFLRRSDN